MDWQGARSAKPWLLPLGFLAAYLALFRVGYAWMGPGVGAFYILICFASGWTLGWRGGVVFGLLSVPVNLLTYGPLQGPLGVGQSMVYVAIDAAIGGGVGWTQDLRRELRQKDGILRQSERMASLGSLVAGVAHEVNNPLCFVQGNEEMTLWDVEALLQRPDVQALPEVTKTLETIRKTLTTNLDGIARIDRINRALKGFASPGHEERALLDLNDVIDGTLIIAHNHLKSRYVIKRDFGSLPPVLGSAQEIGQIVLNLVMNAADAMPDGGAITITTRAEGARVRATFRDEGPGVPRHVQRRLFTPFTTSKQGGTGLGLYISRGIAKSHGGNLVLDPSARGASFTLTLPQAHEPARVPAGPRAAPPPLAEVGA